MRLVVDYGRSGRFPRVSAADVVAGGVLATTFDDRLVLIGGAAAGVGGTFTAPFSALMTGMVRHASVLDNILREIFVVGGKRPIAPAPRRRDEINARHAGCPRPPTRRQRPRQLDVIRFRGMAPEVRRFEVLGAAGADASSA